MRLFDRIRSGRLAPRLAAWIMLFSSMIAVVITATELGIEYVRDIRQIDERMEQIRSAYLDSVVENVWVVDKERLDTLLMGITRLPDFVLAEVRVNGKTLIRQGRELQGEGIRHVFTLQRPHRGQVQDIGELVVAASYESVYARVVDRLLFFLLANTAKASAVALFIFYIFYRLVGRHVEVVARYAKEQARLPEGPALQLHRRGSQEDELSDLSDSINMMRHELLQMGFEQKQRADDMARQAEQLARELQARRKMQKQLDLMATVFQRSHEAIMLTDAQNHIVTVNEAFTQVTGYQIHEVAGHNPRMLSAGRTDAAVYRQMWHALHEHGSWQGELWDRHKSGTSYPKWLSITVVRDEAGQVVNYIGIFSDISERKQAQEEIYQLAHHDHLTGLFNRMSLQQELNSALRQARRNQTALAVMFIDLDRFKNVNDVYGHHVGDQLLIAVAGRLKSGLRDSDVIARLGGDEFVVVLPEVDGPTAVARVADKLCQELARFYEVDGKSLSVTPSIGLALYPADGDTGDLLMKNADTAMYHAKSEGRNNTQFFTLSMENAARERMGLERDLRLAIEQEQIELYYQPQIDGRTGRAVGVEALLRWWHPQHGQISPAKFIPIAEESGLILPLGDWVIHEACRQLRQWRDQGLEQISMSVNLSVMQLGAPNLLEHVGRTLKEFQLAHGDLELEISESGVMKNTDQGIGTLQALREMGVKLSIDDFGTGYSSLSYLQRLPIYALKLDQTFVRDMEWEAANATICASTLSLAHGLGLQVIAEGVETEAQHRMLVKNGCDVLQGYLFSRPLPAEEAVSFLVAHAASVQDGVPGS